uniref:G_PROTEIN_RECEP_F1_2 domain-containing protein n=1 Tax=Panagrellus redivivus TaxID=6233 RepID=A0A7E4VLD5_PANRE
MIVITVIYPVIVDGYQNASNFHCRTHPLNIECESYSNLTYISTVASNVTFAVLSFLLIVLAVYKASTEIRSKALAKLERRMLIYTIFTTMLFILRFSISFLYRVSVDCVDFFYGIWLLVYFMEHYLPMFLLPVFNCVYRQSLITFVMSKRSKKINVTVVTTFQ